MSFETIGTMLFVKEAFTGKSNTSIYNEQEGGYRIGYGFAAFILAVSYGLCWIFDWSREGLNKVMYYLSYPLHAEFLYLKGEPSYKIMFIGSVVAFFVVWLIKNIAQLMMMELSFNDENVWINSFHNAIYLFNLLIVGWSYLIMPLLVIKGLFTGALFLLTVLTS